MMQKVEISPSLMCMNLDKFQEEICFLDSHVDSYHIDIMDGHFVPNITLSPWFGGWCNDKSNDYLSRRS